MQDIAQVSPPDFSYAGMSPIADRDEPYESLVLGMGLRMQEKWQDFRYASARGVDLSVWPWCKGPQINTVHSVRARDEHRGRDVLRAWRRRCTALRGGTSCAATTTRPGRWSKTSARVYRSLNVTVFTSNFDGCPARLGGAQRRVLAQYSANGTTWTAMTTFGALAFAAIGREFWWADDINRLRKCDTNADPTVEANYTSLIFRAGDKSVGHHRRSW